MADAKIINYGQPIGAGSTAIPDNTSVALDIESTDAKNYITIDTTDLSEKMVLNSGQMKPVEVGSSNRGPRMTSTTGATYPSYNFIGDIDTGMTHLGTSNDDQLSLIAGGVEGIRIVKASSAAHVGIGTTEPEAYSALGNKLVLKSGSHCGLTIDTTGTNNGSIIFATDTDDDEGKTDAAIQWTASLDAYRIYATHTFGSLDLGLGAGGKLCIGATPDGNQAANNIYIKNGTAPSADPTTGGFLYVESGALKYRGSGATVTTIAAA